MQISPQEIVEGLRLGLPVVLGWFGNEIRHRRKAIKVDPAAFERRVVERRIEMNNIQHTLTDLQRDLQRNADATANINETLTNLSREFYEFRAEERARHRREDGHGQ